MPRKDKDYRYFACILYPECEEHKNLLNIIKENRIQFPEYVYILHDEDEIEDDEKDTITEMENEELNIKKEHFHMLFKYYTPKTENGILKVFNGTLSKVIGITDYLDYGMYLTHTSPRAILQNKHVYPIENLIGTKFFLNKLNPIQNSYFVQFYEIVKGIEDTRHGTLLEYLHEIEKLPQDEKDYMLDLIHHETRNITQVINDIKNISYQEHLKERNIM